MGGYDALSAVQRGEELSRKLGDCRRPRLLRVGFGHGFALIAGFDAFRDRYGVFFVGFCRLCPAGDEGSEQDQRHEHG